MPVDNFFYEDIAEALENNNPNKLHKYFYQQKYLKDSVPTPFNCVVPLTEKFYGPKVLTILIVSTPYDFPETPTQAILSRIQDAYEQWATYELHIWVDFVLALKILDESSDNTYYMKMEETAIKLEQICGTMEDYGFVYKGRLMEGKDAAFFQTFIDEFYSRKE